MAMFKITLLCKNNVYSLYEIFSVFDNNKYEQFTLENFSIHLNIFEFSSLYLAYVVMWQFCFVITILLALQAF